MATRLLLILSLGALAFQSTCLAAGNRLPYEVSEALAKPTQTTVFSLHPEYRAAHWWNRQFHGYRIFGQVLVSDPKEARRVAADVKRTALTYSGDTKCIIQPRHGVRVVSGPRTYDFLICFECLKMEIFSGDRYVKSLSVDGSPHVMNRILQAARIHIAE